MATLATLPGCSSGGRSVPSARVACQSGSCAVRPRSWSTFRPTRCAAIAFAQFLPGQTLPDGPGKAVVERMCTGYHRLENVVRSRRTRDRWTEVVDDMVSRGAKGTESEADEVIDYLSTHFGPDAVRTDCLEASTSDQRA